MEIKVDVNQLVNDLSQKLGVAVEKVYEMLYTQMIIDGVWCLLWVIGSGIGMYFTYKWAVHLADKIKKEKEKESRWDRKDWLDFPHYIVPIVLLGIFLPITFLVSLKSGMDLLLNPDWQVIKYVLNQIK
jgi:hypothetical protein